MHTLRSWKSKLASSRPALHHPSPHNNIPHCASQVIARYPRAHPIINECPAGPKGGQSCQFPPFLPPPCAFGLQTGVARSSAAPDEDLRSAQNPCPSAAAVSDARGGTRPPLRSRPTCYT
eukprot:320691-Pyramimonas_sp.AAC.1